MELKLGYKCGSVCIKFSFNQTRMELKLVLMFLQKDSLPPFNQTRMELKLVLIFLQKDSLPPFNQTRMELKRLFNND